MTPNISPLPTDEFRARGYRSLSTPLFLLKTKKNSLSRGRLGIIIGKSVYKSAAKRNFWKRQAKEGLSGLILEGNDILIMFSQNITKATKKQFQEELTKTIAKI